MTFDDRIKYKKAVLMYTSTNDKSSPQYMKDKFKKKDQIYLHNLRSKSNDEL